MKIHTLLAALALTGCGSQSPNPPPLFAFEAGLSEAPLWVKGLSKRDDAAALYTSVTSSPSGDLVDALLLCRFDFPEIVTVHGSLTTWEGKLDPVVGITAPDKSYLTYRFGFNQRTVHMAVPQVELKSGGLWDMTIYDQGRFLRDNYVSSLEATYPGAFPFVFSRKNPDIKIQCRVMEKSAQDALASQEAEALQALNKEVMGTSSEKESVALTHDGVTRAQRNTEQLAALVGWRDARVKKAVGEVEALLSKWDERLKAQLPSLAEGAALNDLPSVQVKLVTFEAPDVLKVTFENKSKEKLWISGDASLQEVLCMRYGEGVEIPMGETGDVVVGLTASCAAAWQKGAARPKLFRMSVSQQEGDSRWSGFFWLP